MSKPERKIWFFPVGSPEALVVSDDGERAHALTSDGVIEGVRVDQHVESVEFDLSTLVEPLDPEADE